MKNLPGVNVCGYIDGEFGLGESVRSTIRALQSQNIPTAINNLNVELLQRRNDKSFENVSDENPYPVNIIQINGDMMGDFEKQFDSKYLKDKYNIGYWAWELPDFPENWTAPLYKFNEIWALSDFCADAFAKVSPVPVLRMPLAVNVPTTTITRRALKLPEDKFIFLFIFDFNSTAERKNPQAIIKAFKEAFGADERVFLVLKSINGGFISDKFQAMKAAAGDAKNIRAVDGVWDRKDVLALISHCDCYVSLHRSEGFGFTIAEAMFCGKPVIATDYSANAEFMNVGNSYPVRYELKRLEEDYPPYLKGSRWAEPDVAHAAELMRRVFENREERECIGARAAKDAGEMFDARVIGQRMKRRLEYINFLNDGFRQIPDPQERRTEAVKYELKIIEQKEKVRYLEAKIEDMQASKFWKIRNGWWNLKRRLWLNRR